MSTTAKNSRYQALIFWLVGFIFKHLNQFESRSSNVLFLWLGHWLFYSQFLKFSSLIQILIQSGCNKKLTFVGDVVTDEKKVDLKGCAGDCTGIKWLQLDYIFILWSGYSHAGHDFDYKVCDTAIKEWHPRISRFLYVWKKKNTKTIRNSNLFFLVVSLISSWGKKWNELSVRRERSYTCAQDSAGVIIIMHFGKEEEKMEAVQWLTKTR